MDAMAYAGGAGDCDDAFRVIAVLRKPVTEFHMTQLKWKSSVH